jgi:hypothetical protein
VAIEGRETRHADYQRVRAERLFEDRESALARKARVANAIAEGFPEAVKETFAKLQTDAARGFGNKAVKNWFVKGTGSSAFTKGSHAFTIDQEEVDVTRGIRDEVVNHLRELDPALEIEDVDYLAPAYPRHGTPVHQVVGLSVPIDRTEVE